MVVYQQLCLIQLLIGFQDSILDHLQRAAGTFTGPKIFQDKLFFRLPVVIIGGILGKRRHNRIRNQFILQCIFPQSVYEGWEFFTGLTVPPIDVDEVRNGCRYGFRGQLDRHLTDLSRAIHLPAKMELGERRRMLADTLPDTVQADCREAYRRAYGAVLRASSWREGEWHG